MQDTQIIEVDVGNFQEVFELVGTLLTELEPSAAEEIESMHLCQITKELLNCSKFWAFLAKYGNTNVGVVTLHQCAVI